MTRQASQIPSRAKSALVALSPWILAGLLLAILPQILTASSTITIMNQMAITTVFALSYNMLLGQAGMLSFGHAIFLGFGGFFCIHAINFAQAEGLPIPLPVLPLIAGLFSLGMAMVIGSFSTRRSGTIFAMLSLGVVELVATFSVIAYSFFRGGGVGADRTLGVPFFGVEFLRQIEVYYLISVWLVLSAALMYCFSRTPLGRMANAVRDNPDRAEYLGYSARWVRFFSFSAAGFFAGIAGGLFAINYEIASSENLSVEASGTILMIVVLGGTGFFLGPVLGAILFTLLQTVLSFHTDLWQLYLGVLFLATVMFFPTGLAGLAMAHVLVIQRGRFGSVARPYFATIAPAILGAMSLCAFVELVFHSRNALLANQNLALFWISFDISNPIPWIIAPSIAVLGIWLARRNSARFAAAWQEAQS